LSNPADMMSSNTVKTEVNRLNIIKSADKDFIAIGGEITYTLTVKNPSTIAADDVEIIDNLPDGMSVINISDGGNMIGGQVVWNIGSLGANEEKSVTITLRLNEGFECGTINNTVVVKHNDVSQAGSTIELPINGLFLKMSADKNDVTVGDIIDFALEYGNRGCLPLTNVVVESEVPKALEWAEGGEYIADRRVVVFRLGDLPPSITPAPPSVAGRRNKAFRALQANKVTYKVKVLAPCQVGGAWSDIAIPTAVLTGDFVSPVTDSVPITIHIDFSPVVTLEFAPPGAQLEYTVTYLNQVAKMTNAILRIKISEHTTYVRTSGNITGHYSEETREATWDLGTLDCDDSGVLKLVVCINPDVPPGTIIEGIARFASDQVDEATSTARTTVVESGLDIVTTAVPSAPEPVAPNEEINYTITYANSGDTKFEKAFIKDKVPENTVLVSVGNDGTVDDENVVTWSLGALSPGDSGSVELVVKVINEPTESLLASKTIINIATMEASHSLFCSPVIELSSVETPVNIQQNLQVDKKAEPTEARLGDIITYTITCSNSGNIDFTDVKIEDTLPPELEFVDFIGKAGEYKDGKITFDVGKLEVGKESQEFQYEARIKDDIDATKVHQIKNVVIAKQGDSPPARDEEIIYAIPDFLKIALAGNKRVLEIGDPIAFVIDVENTSVDTTIKDVIIVNFLPPGLKYIEGTSRIEGKKVSDPKEEEVYNTQTGTPQQKPDSHQPTALGEIKQGPHQKLTWEIGNLNPKDKVRLIFRATLEPTVSDRTFGLENTCFAQGTMESNGVLLKQGAEVKSAEAKWQIRVRRGMFNKLGQIIGKVFVDENHNKFQDGEERGFPNARLYTEDGTIITTDEKGKYHTTQVEPGYHVIKIDKSSIEGHEVVVHTTRYAALQGTNLLNGEPKRGQFVNVPENGTAKIDFVLKALSMSKHVEMKQVPDITPIVEQPKALVAEVHIPFPEIEQPTLVLRQVPQIIPEIEQPIAIPMDTGASRVTAAPFGLLPVRVALPIIANPAQPPNVKIDFKPDRIPAGDPKITVTSPDILLNVIAEHPDGRKIQLKKKANGSWQEEFTVPFDSPEGPYPFTFWITDQTGREWYLRRTVMVDNTIPNVYAEFVPKTAKRGVKTQLKVTLLIDATTVYVTFRDTKKTLHLKRDKRFHWSVGYTIPQNMRPGWHNAQVVVVPKEDPRFKQRAIVAYEVE